MMRKTDVEKEAYKQRFKIRRKDSGREDTMGEGERRNRGKNKTDGL